MIPMMIFKNPINPKTQKTQKHKKRKHAFSYLIHKKLNQIFAKL